MNWISVEERLPEEGQRVQIKSKGRVSGKESVSEGIWMGRLGFWWSDGKGKVTHWMEINPPKEDNQ
jgi:hypothetical protein